MMRLFQKRVARAEIDAAVNEARAACLAMTDFYKDCNRTNIAEIDVLRAALREALEVIKETALVSPGLFEPPGADAATKWVEEVTARIQALLAETPDA